MTFIQCYQVVKEIIVTTPHPTAAFVAARAGAMAKHTEHSILGVIENMSYFESKETGKKSMYLVKVEDVNLRTSSIPIVRRTTS